MSSRRIHTHDDVNRLASKQRAATRRGPALEEHNLEGTEKPAAAASSPIVPAPYMEALSKLIPPEVVAAFLAIDGIVRASSNAITPITYGCIFVAILALTAGYIHVTSTEPDLPPAWKQIILGTVGFLVWAYCIGGPFDYGPSEFFPYNPALGGIVAIVYTLAAPLVAKR